MFGRTDRGVNGWMGGVSGGMEGRVSTYVGRMAVEVPSFSVSGRVCVGSE